jgi:hypothetical protein
MVICARMPALVRGLGDLAPGIHGLVDARSLVALAEAFAGGDGHADFGTPRPARAS